MLNVCVCVCVYRVFLFPFICFLFNSPVLTSGYTIIPVIQPLLPLYCHFPSVLPFSPLLSRQLMSKLSISVVACCVAQWLLLSLSTVSGRESLNAFRFVRAYNQSGLDHPIPTSLEFGRVRCVLRLAESAGMSTGLLSFGRTSQRPWTSWWSF